MLGSASVLLPWANLVIGIWFCCPPIQLDESAMPFRLDRESDVERLLKSRRLAISQCIKTLERHANNRDVDPELALRAVEVLSELRANERGAMVALSKNLMMRPMPAKGGTPSRLTGLPAAEALVRIGGSETAKEIVGRVRKTGETSEVRVLACILSQIEPPEACILRLDAAIAAERHRPLRTATPDEHYIQRLRQMKEWLAVPGYFDDPFNWPSLQFKQIPDDRPR